MKLLRNLWKSERGSIPIEGVYGTFLLLIWYVIAFQIYDAFRMHAATVRASYTVSDLISREVNAIGPKYVAGIKKVFDYISNAPNDKYSWIRVSLIECNVGANTNTNCDGINKDFTLMTSGAFTGSYVVGGSGIQKHTNASIKQERGRIPIMKTGDMAVIVETSMFYFPLFGIGDKELKTHSGAGFVRQGLSAKMRFSNFVVTRPRGPRVVWNDLN